MANRGNVVLLHCDDIRGDHQCATLEAMARRIAQLRHVDYAGEHDAGRHYQGPVYFVPSDTLLGADAARLGIRGHHDLFGGVVPHAFVATKAVSHPLLPPPAAMPPGWSPVLASGLGDAVLPGYAVFDKADARRAFRLLAPLGAVRLKPARGKGGVGQWVVTTADELDAALATLDAVDLQRHGATLEQELAQTRTCSIGWVHFPGLPIAYYGTQRTTPDRHGHPVYGGSDLVVARGGMQQLLALELPAQTRTAIHQARRYHAAIVRAFPGFYASRHNYDVIQGLDREGRPRSGVLEQSWRIGGASTAEIAALEAFAADPGLRVVHAASREVHALEDCPPGARVYFSGIDRGIGAITKYSLAGDHGPRH